MSRTESDGSPASFVPSAVHKVMAIFCAFILPFLGTLSADARTSDQRAARSFRSFLLDPAWKPYLNSLPSVEVDAGGRVGLNRNTFSYPELQCVGADFVIRGLLNGREDWRQQGWHILDAGFGGMHDDGQLQGLGQDLVHSSAFFLYGVGEAMLVDDQGATPGRVARFLKAVGHLTQGRQLEEGRAMVQRFTHRAFLWSFLLRSASTLDGTNKWNNLAREFMETGLAAQRYDGVIPEVGEFDALYACIGLVRLLNSASIEDDSLMKSRQLWAAQRELSLLVARVDERGRLFVNSSPRLLGERDRGGKNKRLTHWQIEQTFVAAAIALHEPLFIKIASRVMSCKLECQPGFR